MPKPTERPPTAEHARLAEATGHVSLPWDDLRGRPWRLDDASTGARYERAGDDLRDGLYVALDPWSWHLFELTPLHPPGSQER